MFDQPDLDPGVSGYLPMPRKRWNKRRNRMAIKKHGVIIETPTEARQAEPGPSILFLLLISLSIAVVTLAIVYFVFFRT
ncbi:hypothetical protein JQ597_10900 [Bradyrhizobium sp. AUGA SZCCT0177]|uniref:hypothetical protein n=2 Tax=Bradyrhizobium TaxID=374 RepID=UPI001BA7E080|nr:hypothetical protein [Bradyrhizobium sp. AUGA SZCCT0177]MBR1282545.1 hypothetical protein [Bradyrhizobium sp. AUGA SZCCT0177]